MFSAIRTTASAIVFSLALSAGADASSWWPTIGWPFNAASTTHPHQRVDRISSHSSHLIIGQGRGRYVARTTARSYPINIRALPHVDRFVAHSSYRLIGLSNGRFVANTIVPSLQVPAPVHQRMLQSLSSVGPAIGRIARTNVVARIAPRVAARAAPYALTAGAASTAPAWGPAALTLIGLTGLGYSSYELYNYARHQNWWHDEW